MYAIKEAWWSWVEWGAKQVAAALPDRVVYLVLVHSVAEVSKSHRETLSLTCFDMLMRWRDRGRITPP